jgi:hypothetical protein
VLIVDIFKKCILLSHIQTDLAYAQIFLLTELATNRAQLVTVLGSQQQTRLFIAVLKLALLDALGELGTAARVEANCVSQTYRSSD